MRNLEISELTPGMVVAENVMTLRNELLYPAGYRLTAKAITKLRFYSIPFICIEDENDHFSYEEMKSYSERVRSTPEFQLFAEEFEKDVYKFKNTLNDVVEKHSPLDIHDLLQDTLALLHTSSQNIHIFEMINNMRQYDDSTYAHSINVALIANVLAGWLGMNEQDILLVTQCGLLHDIGKSVDHEVEGSHIQIGVDLCRKYKESGVVINAVESHHGDVEPQTLVACIVQAADAISAARPGARRETIETYTNRLKQLEEITNSFKGVEKSFAIQAGREVRIMVVPEQINDDAMVLLAREVSKRIENELEYPGQIKVNVIRESRVTDYAK